MQNVEVSSKEMKAFQPVKLTPCCLSYLQKHQNGKISLFQEAPTG